MKYEPHDYQKFAVDFIETHPQAAILIGCGLERVLKHKTCVQSSKYDII